MTLTDGIAASTEIPMTPLGSSSSSSRAPSAAPTAPIRNNDDGFINRFRAMAHPIALFSLSFFLLGLLNNSLYVVILTSALELLPKGVPTGLVALANIGPALIAKAIWPYALRGRVRYARRITACTVLSTVGMLITAFIPTLSARLVGISMASFSSGLGELTFLQLCTRYGTLRAGRGVAWFASGTGAAGLFGAGAWWVVRPLGVKGGLSIMSALPLIMAAAYFVLLPTVEAIKDFEANAILRGAGGYEAVRSSDEDAEDEDEDEDAAEDIDAVADTPVKPPHTPSKLNLQDKLALLRPMLVPFIAPLVLVYLFEYTINQGIAPTLLYPVPLASEHLLLSWLIKNLKDYYPLYQLTYQTFVFLSRSSLSILHIPPIPKSLLWLPAIVQLLIALLLTSESLHFWFRDSIARSLVIVLVGVEGLAGGWAYVSVFYQIGTSAGDANDDATTADDQVRRGQEQEFRVGCVGVGDSMGILVASLISMPIQLGLCDVQVEQLGRDLCRQI